MHNTFRSWNLLLAKLGYTRRRRSKPAAKLNQYSRRLKMESLEDRRVLAVITVDTLLDELDESTTDGDISLRDAIFAAVSGDTIDFDPTEVNGGTITLDRTSLGQIDIVGKSLTIDASMLPSGITIDADDPSSTPGDGIRIFNITEPLVGHEASG